MLLDISSRETLRCSNGLVDLVDDEPKMPRWTGTMTTSKPAPFQVEYEVPNPRSVLDYTPTGPGHGYAQALTLLLDLDLKKDHLRLLQSINRLLCLHEVVQEDLIEDFDLTVGSMKSIKDLSDSLCQAPHIFELFLGKEKYTYLIDMCNFMYYSSLVKNDIDLLPDAKINEAFERLYDAICTDGEHMWHDT